MKTLRERIADALDAAFDKHRRNNVFRIYVADQRLMPWHNSPNVKEIYVLTQNDSLPLACNPNDHGALLWKSHYKACKERYLDQIMKLVA